MNYLHLLTFYRSYLHLQHSDCLVFYLECYLDASSTETATEAETLEITVV